MALIQTEAKNLLRDTSNMALINNNVKAYELYKKVRNKHQEKDEKIQNLESQVNELKSILTLLLNSQQ